MKYMNKPKACMTIQLSLEQIDWLKKKDMKLLKMLDKYFIRREEIKYTDLSMYHSIISTYSTTKDYDIFFKVEKMFDNRCY